MAILRMTDERLHAVPDVHPRIDSLDNTSTIEDELDAMVGTIQDLVNQGMTPDVLMTTCMAFMGRCTELLLALVRIEGKVRKAKQLRTAQLNPVMELIDFTYKGASRLIENRRQEIELSR